jgi:hypothetical protein
VTKDRPAYADVRTVVPFNPQTGGPFSQGEASKTREYAQVKNGHGDCDYDRDRLGGIPGRTSATTKGARDQRSKNNNRGKRDVVD